MGKITCCLDRLNNILLEIKSIDAIIDRIERSDSDRAYPVENSWRLDDFKRLRSELLSHAEYYRNEIANYKKHLLPAPQSESILLEFELTPDFAPESKDQLTDDLTRTNRI